MAHANTTATTDEIRRDLPLDAGKIPLFFKRDNDSIAHMAFFYRGLLVATLLFCSLGRVLAQSGTVLLSEPGFPGADSSSIREDTLRRGFRDAAQVGADQLSNALSAVDAKLLVLPYGSAYPEAAWPAILRFLDRGGDLIVLGGKPFTRAAFRDGNIWLLRPPSVAASLELLIDDYQVTSGSQASRFEPSPDVHPQLPPFAWKQAFSPVIRLSVTPMSPKEMGTTGNEDAYLTTLAWGTQAAHRLSAPALLIDHVRERFVGGRWIFLACEPEGKGFDDPQLLATLQTLALRRDDRFTFRPRVPLFLPGELLEFHYQPARTLATRPGDVLKISVHSDDSAARSFSFPADASQTITLPQSAATGQGLHTAEATLWRDGVPLWTYRSGFWIRDWTYLRDGPKLTVGADYFALDGKPLPVVGTTYMASDVNRLYLVKPNAFVWDQDMKQIHAAGLNMVRSGIWSGWDLLVNPDKTISEDTLRAIEAFLMTARRYNLPVQFNLFAFVPDAFGGSQPYLDPAALQLQDRYVFSLVRRFRDVPFLAWDLINEPSANENAWKTLPQHDSFEEAAWREWLKQRHPDQASLLAAWAEPSFGIGRSLQSMPTSVSPAVAAADPFAMPPVGAFDSDGVRSGFNPLKVFDYFLFTQTIFKDWVRHQQKTIHAAGSDQLVTVGQDEGGVSGRVSPAFFSPDVSFTTTHTWWDFDSLLWASLAAKMPGKPMLVQEMGEQRRLTQDDHLRLSAEEEGWQLERKLASSFAQGAGGLEWVWNVNATMANDNEIPIGAIRPDGTEKPEVAVLAGFAQIANRSPGSFTAIEPPAITIVTSQSLLYTGMNALAVATQKKAVRALAYYVHSPMRMLPENRLMELGQPKLVILPAPQALTDEAWKQLLDYVAHGGCLLISGPVQYNEHWQKIDRLLPLQIEASVFPVAVRQSALKLPGENRLIPVTFPAAVQQAPIDTLRFADGAAVKTIEHGAGKIIWAADPVEFSEEYDATAALYEFAERVAGITPAFRQLHPLSPGVLAFPTVLKEAILYSFSSESLDDQQIDIEDAATKARVAFTLRAQHGAMILLNRANGAVQASYGLTSR